MIWVAGMTVTEGINNGLEETEDLFLVSHNSHTNSKSPHTVAIVTIQSSTPTILTSTLRVYNRIPQKSIASAVKMDETTISSTARLDGAVDLA
jgi:hypothetical protein